MGNRRNRKGRKRKNRGYENLARWRMLNGTYNFKNFDLAVNNKTLDKLEQKVCTSSAQELEQKRTATAEEITSARVSADNEDKNIPLPVISWAKRSYTKRKIYNLQSGVVNITSLSL